MYYIGVDLGTSAVKLLLMDEAGRILNVVSKEYPLYFPNPGWSEQRPEDWYDKSIEGMKELIKGFDADKVAGISFGGQMHGLVILDENDKVIRPAILWNDGRTIEENDYLNNVIGKDKLSSYTANISFTGFTAPKILWVKNKEPENFVRIRKIMLPKDYLAYRLTGVHCTDYSDASGMLLLDVKNKCWSKEMIEICGIKEEMLPKLFESFEKVGTLKSEIARELGFPDEVIVAAGAGDNAAAAVGTGTVGIFHLEHREQYLSQAIHLALMSTMHFTRLHMLTDIFILWDVCSVPHPAISGGWMRLSERRTMRQSRRTLTSLARTVYTSFRILWENVRHTMILL